MPSFDIGAVARRFNEENRAEDAKAAARREAARVEARRLAAAMRAKDSGIRAIFGFGSTFEETRPYRMDSDIDLAIEGGDILRLLSVTEDSAFSVDLIDITGAEDEFAREIRARGMRL